MNILTRPKLSPDTSCKLEFDLQQVVTSTPFAPSGQIPKVEKLSGQLEELHSTSRTLDD